MISLKITHKSILLLHTWLPSTKWNFDLSSWCNDVGISNTAKTDLHFLCPQSSGHCFLWLPHTATLSCLPAKATAIWECNLGLFSRYSCPSDDSVMPAHSELQPFQNIYRSWTSPASLQPVAKENHAIFTSITSTTIRLTVLSCDFLALRLLKINLKIINFWSTLPPLSSVSVVPLSTGVISHANALSSLGQWRGCAAHGSYIL